MITEYKFQSRRWNLFQEPSKEWGKYNICEGLLKMQIHSWKFPSWVWLWKRRYFKLRQNRLYFIEKQGDLLHPESTPYITIEIDTDICPEIQKGKLRDKYFIRIKKKTTYVLQAYSEPEWTKWVAALLTVISSNYLRNFKIGRYETVKLKQAPEKRQINRSRHSKTLDRDSGDKAGQQKLTTNDNIKNKINNVNNNQLQNLQKRPENTEPMLDLSSFTNRMLLDRQDLSPFFVELYSQV